MTQLTKPTLEKQIDALVEMRERFLVMAIAYKVGDQFDGDFQSIEDAIESLRELAAQMKAERDDALANHKAAEENVSELMAEAFAAAPVAGGNVVSATEDSLSAAGESPAFTQWAETEYGDVRPAWVSALKKAFAAGAEQAEARNVRLVELLREAKLQVGSLFGMKLSDDINELLREVDK